MLKGALSRYDHHFAIKNSLVRNNVEHVDINFNIVKTLNPFIPRYGKGAVVKIGHSNLRPGSKELSYQLLH